MYTFLLQSYYKYVNDVFYYRNNQWEINFIVAKNGQVNPLIQLSYNTSSKKLGHVKTMILSTLSSYFDSQ
jgi:predicted AAA+ superfamily ATPase